ncbi:MAG: tetratricopeptide repeat protein [Muribaculaceae bacterium]|nr:tetratricopeptide repeat protein [Muribaculaceae bacterium]
MAAIAVMTAIAARPVAGPAANSRRQKARYYYMEGVRLQMDRKDAESYELFHKALRIDPTYAEAQSAVGQRRLAIDDDEHQSPEAIYASLAMMRPFVEQYPGDFFESSYYAYLAAHLDTLPEAIRVYERTDSLFPTKTATLYTLADVYMADHQPLKAIEALDRYEKIEGKSAPVSLRKIGYMIQSRDTAGALREADELVAYSPKEPGFRILRGNVFAALGMPDSAFNAYTGAERIAPDNGAAKLALADWYKEKGDSAAYDAKTYEALLSEDFGVEQKTALLAQYLQRLLTDKSNTARGDTLFQVLRRQYPHEPEVLDLDARFSAAKGELKTAVEQIRYAIDLNRENPDYWGQLMSYQLADDLPQEAIATYEEAADGMEEVPEGMKLLLAQAAVMTKDFDRTASIYDALIKESHPSLTVYDSIPDKSVLNTFDYETLMRVSTLFNLAGDAYYTAKEIPLAFTNYENALATNPTNSMVLNNYAYFLTEEGGDIERAYEMSRRAVDIDPDNPTFVDTYAWVLFKKGEYDEALVQQQKAVEKSEEAGDISAELYSHLGDILFRLGRPDEAVEAWQKALDLNPGDEGLKQRVKTRRIPE